MKRFHQPLLIGTFLPFCWLAMMAVHELGHVGCAIATGGSVQQVVLHPLAISRTDVSPNSRPLTVAWGGPVVGVVLPFGLLVALKLTKTSLSYLAQFFAGFCLVANGAYIGVGSFARIGDAGEILRYGSAIWCLWLFGAATIPLGLWLWNGLGPNFGLGAAAGRVERRAAYLSCALLLLTVILEVALSSR
jgi:hypothetical protein